MKTKSKPSLEQLYNAVSKTLQPLAQTADLRLACVRLYQVCASIVQPQVNVLK